MAPDDAALILHRLGEQDKQLQRIEMHVKETNGRVLKLERNESYMRGGLAVLALGLPVVCGVAVALINGAL